MHQFYFSCRYRAARGSAVYGDSRLGQRLRCEPVDPVVGSLEQVVHSGGCSNIRAEMNPADRLMRQSRTRAQKCFDAEVAKFVPTRRDELDGASPLMRPQMTHHFQPTCEPASPFGSTMPPAAERCHDHKRRKTFVGSRQACRDVE